MALRLVVCVRWRPAPALEADAEAEATAGESWGVVARTLAERATALGGRIVGWQQGSLSVDFAVDGLQDAVDFLVDEPLGASLAGGFALGELEECLEGHRIALCSGEVLDVVQSLADAARPGEVLVSPELVQASRGELLTTGPVKKRPGREQVAAFALDVVHPLRSLLVEAMAGLVDPPWLGDRSLLARLSPPQGELALLLAEAGGGGTRCLEELGRERPEVLWVRPGPAGWPGGALARAVGAAPDATVAELDEQLRSSRAALVLIDDAELLDGDSLELLATWCGSGQAALVLRVRGAVASASGSLAFPENPALERVVGGARIAAVETLTPLSGSQAAEFARAATSGRLGRKELDAIAALGEQKPLEIFERLSGALESGDWVLVGPSIRARSDRPLAPAPLDACLAGRLAGMPADQRLVLETSVVLGHADPNDIARVLEMLHTTRLAEVDALVGQVGSMTLEEVTRRVQQLVLGRWLRGGPFRVASATVARVVEAETPAERLQGLHALSARIALRSNSWAGRIAAVAHAARAGRPAQARDLARSAEALAARAGAHATGTALQAFAEDGELAALWARGLLGALTQPELPLDLETGADGALELGATVSAPLPEAPPVTPVPPGSVPAPLGSDAGPPAFAPSLESASELSARPLAEPSAPSLAEPSAASPATSDSDSLYPKQLGDAIARRDPTSLLQLAASARLRHQEAFAERLEALASLVRGQAGEALARLRRARERALDAGPTEQCRAELALAVGLAASGRGREAFLGALAGLARAREAGDGRGERACARFLGELAEQMGHAPEARSWRALAEE
jgi:hypothetical protein